jgi:hypothetical protein
MTADNQTTQATSAATLQRLRVRLRPLARRALWRLAPSYARRRAANADAAGRLARLERELERVGERHDEQIERLEDLARELILAVESLRRSRERD